ncbi:hypothetical protein F7725_012036 [Dissostichus mawsoni]|uniref:Protein FAM151A n=1 Tax=Dissostichus mawsoni TaxID=36200 RepID=A0A7J5ZAM2_DISMA|nr:hypothetical protein F7725_012036 [Dissostichus mawsoni]
MGETEERSDRGTEESPERSVAVHEKSDEAVPPSSASRTTEQALPGLSEQPQLILISVAAGLVPLIIIITVAAVLATNSSTALPSFSTGGDMLDFLVQSGDAMILEADITLEGYGTANENAIPIMAHPPDIYSDNTLDQWMDAVLASRKGMKLDFKTLRSVGLSLDLLSQKSKNSSRGINRPVWVNADILLGPNAPAFLPTVNGTRFSLTLWQGSIRPNISDLLFIRENSHPARVYYDIYEPTLSAFRQAASQQGLLRRFYPGGDLMEFLYPNHNSDFLSTAPRRSSLDVRWVRVTDRTSLLETLSGRYKHGVSTLTHSLSSSQLSDLLELLGQRAEAPWGVYLRIHSQQLLEASLTRLHSAYSQEKLYRPVFVSTVERLFPYVTLVLKQQNLPAVSQRVALHVNTASLQTGLRAFSLTRSYWRRHLGFRGLKRIYESAYTESKNISYLTSDQSQLRRDMTNPPF